MPSSVAEASRALRPAAFAGAEALTQEGARLRFAFGIGQRLDDGAEKPRIALAHMHFRDGRPLDASATGVSGRSLAFAVWHAALEPPHPFFQVTLLKLPSPPWAPWEQAQ